ncbi:hypothetical protein [Leptolyngbya sp. PCC 6406]|nr:hypothetical protein [Leptolyngbya sp. PCC 6406]
MNIAWDRIAIYPMDLNGSYGLAMVPVIAGIDFFYALALGLGVMPQ